MIELKEDIIEAVQDATDTVDGTVSMPILDHFLDGILTEQCNIADVSGSFLFDKSLLEKATIKQPEYVMGVDTYDKDALAYCLIRKVDGVVEILLCKTMRDENEFKQEVENLAKYFNADVFRSGE